MKKREQEWDLPEEPFSSDHEEVINRLHQYEVDFPDEAEMNRTVEAVKMYMTENTNRRSLIKDHVFNIIRVALMDITYIKPLYWIVSILLYTAGILFYWTGQNPYFIVLTLSPLPFILGIFEIFRGRDEGMLELEMSFKFNAASMMLSKLFIIAVFNILLNSLLSVYFAVVQENLNLLHMTMYWLTPFTMVCGLSLMIATRVRSNYSVACLISIWIILCLSLLKIPALEDKLTTMNKAAYALLIVLGTVLFIIQIKLLFSKTTSYFERNVRLETNY